MNWVCSSTTCEKALPRDHESGEPCPYCGQVGRTFQKNIDCAVEIRSSFGLKKKNPAYPSKKRVRVELFDGWELRKSVGDLVRKFRRIDKDAGTYAERVVTENGDLIHECDEPLAEHFGHGSDKFSPSKKA